MKRTISLLLAFLSLSTAAYADDASPVQLLAVNVGKADALLLSSGADTYLIDTGTAESWGQLSCALNTLGVTHLRGVILTHTHKDHAGGAFTLATSTLPVEAWYAPQYYTDVKEKKHPAVLAANLRQAEVTWLRAGDVLPLGDGQITVLGPLSESDTENCNSLVLLVEGGGGRMLLTGDMEFPEETELLTAGAIPRSDVLKVANHANKDATSDALVRQVQPRIAVISTNTAEEPDTPAVRVTSALRSVGADIYQTQHGQAGVLVTLQNGQATAQNMDYTNLPPLQTGVILTGRDPDADHIRLRNTTDAPIDLSGWYLHSDRGGEQFVLPAGTVLAPGAELLISTLSSDTPGDLTWPEKKVWHDKKDDAATLYDACGRLIFTLE